MNMKLYEVELETNKNEHHNVIINARSSVEALEVAIDQWNKNDITSLQEHEESELVGLHIHDIHELDTPVVLSILLKEG